MDISDMGFLEDGSVDAQVTSMLSRAGFVDIDSRALYEAKIIWSAARKAEGPGSDSSAQ